MPKIPRPERWLYKDPQVRQQYYAFLRMRSQALFRSESFDLTFEDYQKLWGAKWQDRGQQRDQLCMVRPDPDGGWSRQNIEILPRSQSKQYVINRIGRNRRD